MNFQSWAAEKKIQTIPNYAPDCYPAKMILQGGSFWQRDTLITRYRKIFLKRLIQGLFFKGILKGQESKSWDFFEGPRRFRGPQKLEKLNFLKRTNKSVAHEFKSFAIN